ncbi:hypothetical protein [Corynebacterium uterequi]|uniref:Uncharacterized protein n=1 Tax=Corynebacterium uterequi TaxID=1072256 RepID=A0A0G3HDW7_9CORY|nr:hypothetical protein [Corynebacterium uterequi]AKK11566.1 hypothetical protein CUTER_07905 [Corynebacterium uterequi]
MHYTWWDRENTAKPVLRNGDDDSALATFDGEIALVGDEQWALSHNPTLGASVTLPDGREFQAFGRLKKDERIPVSLDGASLTIVAETSKEFVVEDADGAKVAQFTGSNHGVRKAIVEYSDDADMSTEGAIALAYFSRIMLEARTVTMGTALIGTLALLSLAAIVAALI